MNKKWEGEGGRGKAKVVTPCVHCLHQRINQHIEILILIDNLFVEFLDIVFLNSKIFIFFFFLSSNLPILPSFHPSIPLSFYFFFFPVYPFHYLIRNISNSYSSQHLNSIPIYHACLIYIHICHVSTFFVGMVSYYSFNATISSYRSIRLFCFVLCDYSFA